MHQTMIRVSKGVGLTGFVPGASPLIQAINGLAEKIARTKINVLITGESGTGKEVYARLIHALSEENEGRFCKINCSAVEAVKLLTERHAFLSGQPDSGECGTIYFDNLEDADPAWQKLLLTYLSDGSRTNGDGQFPGRLIGSSSKSLEKEVENGRFRPELFFRLSGVCLHLPALRDRKEDIALFVESFLEEFAEEMGKPVPQLDENAKEALTAYRWPGNIRELENWARRLMVVGDIPFVLNELQESRLDARMCSANSRISSLKVAARAALQKTERELILQALERTKWNRKRAAQELQISYKSLLFKMKQIGMSSGDSEH